MKAKPTSKEIRKIIEREFKEVLKNPRRKSIPILRRRDAYGHEAGIPIEEWVKSNLENIDWEVQVYFPDEFLKEIFSKIGRNENKIKSVFQKTWWGFKFERDRLLVTEKQIRSFIRNGAVERWQQEAGDIVLFYGNEILNDINEIILLNVKSHYVKRESRPPNIMSAERLLKFFNSLLNRSDAYEMLEKVNLWFVGVSYDITSTGAIAKSVHIRDMFLLDLSKLPQINFDAAIQIQWHVKDMVEITQDKFSFVEKLADTFMEQWLRHVKSKQEKYEGLAKTLKDRIRKIRGS